MTKMTKLHVIAAVEPTSGINPETALAQARAIPRKLITRVVIADYLPAFEELTAKGYTQQEAAEMLVSMGAPFSADSMIVRLREKKRADKRAA